MTKQQDFSAISYIGKDMDFDSIVTACFERGEGALTRWNILLFSYRGPLSLALSILLLRQKQLTNTTST